MSQAFKYNLIHFQPNVETGEFAVAGVVVFSPSTRQIAYKLLSSDQYQRITAFFRPMDSNVLQGAMQRLEAELARVQSLITQVENPVVLYKELTMKRESIIRFSPDRVILNTDIQDCADDLFQRYVDRNHPLAA